MRSFGKVTVVACIALSTASLAAMPVAALAQTAPTPRSIWAALSTAFFHGQKMAQDGSIITLGTPLSAENAALVPVTLHMNVGSPSLKPDDPNRVKKVTLIIDENPSPVAAVFELGTKASITGIETRVRVDQNTEMHAVAETNSGKLYVSASYVTAAGGCSAPSADNLDPNDPQIGRIKVRQVPNQYVTADPRRKEAVVMIKHPNNSGLQMNETTHLYIPARYINSLTVMQGNSLLFSLTGGISISEDPNFRFDYLSTGADVFHVTATDTTGKLFNKESTLRSAM